MHNTPRAGKKRGRNFTVVAFMSYTINMNMAGLTKWGKKVLM